MKYVILGTAGHIDHGKSSLVKALTGTDPDRLKEEKERGITLDLGFASLDLPSGNRLGIVDVPGHEGLIKNMLAGVGGIDIVMLVIAADESVMPQTREHLAICDLLHVKQGLIALTKMDLVDKEWLGLAQDEVREFVKGTFLEKAPIVPLSARTGENLDRLKQELDRIAKDVAPKSPSGILRLPIDRVFTMKGFGTVITGTLHSGSISQDQEVEILPRDLRTKVRGIQSHGKAAQRAVAGQRTAVNLQNVEKDQLHRGDTIVTKGFFAPTRTLDASLRLLPGAGRTLKTGSRIRFYNTTQEALGRITLVGAGEMRPGDEGFVQFRLESSVIVQNGDRYIIRFYSPVETLGGGMVLDPRPRRHRARTMADSVRSLTTLAQGTLDERIGILINGRSLAGMEENELIGAVAADKQEIQNALSLLVQKRTILRADTLYVHSAHVAELESKVLRTVAAYHQMNPLKPGLDKEELRGMLKVRLNTKLLNVTLDGLIKRKQLEQEGAKLRMPGFRATVSVDQDAVREKIVAAIRAGGAQPPIREEFSELFKISDRDAKDLLKLLASEGRVVRVNDSIYLAAEALERMRQDLTTHLQEKKEITIAEFRDLARTSRKYAVPLMEYFDSQKLTQRVGDKRVLRG
jgi:selenocysteine-specific elongation factor